MRRLPLFGLYYFAKQRAIICGDRACRAAHGAASRLEECGSMLGKVGFFCAAPKSKEHLLTPCLRIVNSLRGTIAAGTVYNY